MIHDASLAGMLPLLLPLNRYGVEFRYPGEFATVDEAWEAVKTVRTLRRTLRKKLEL